MNILLRFAALNKTAHSFLEPYETDPKKAVSLWNNIPIKHLEKVREMIKPLSGLRILFRGPRYDYTRGYTRKADAVGFSVYQK